MKRNRSVPEATVVPVLIYPDVREAVDWLTGAFGFVERVRIGERDGQGNESVGPVEYLPLFTDYPPQTAITRGWVRTVREYQSFAALAFA